MHVALAPRPAAAAAADAASKRAGPARIVCRRHHQYQQRQALRCRRVLCLYAYRHAVGRKVARGRYLLFLACLPRGGNDPAHVSVFCPGRVCALAPRVPPRTLKRNVTAVAGPKRGPGVLFFGVWCDRRFVYSPGVVHVDSPLVAVSSCLAAWAFRGLYRGC